VGTLGRHIRGERSSGDHAAFVRLEDALLLAVADGLGHGQPAREASFGAIRCAVERPDRALDETLALCHEALQRTRGAVMSLTRLEEPSGEVALAAVGNVSTNVFGPAGVLERHIGSSAALGMPGQPPRVRIERAHLRSWDALVQFTDGLSGRASLDGEASLLREHPILIAQHLFEKFGSDQDDVLVQVAR
ncbi:MAG TPA: SpoIIE family protein phosphatase, partial [Polyangiaceae bacterium]